MSVLPTRDAPHLPYIQISAPLDTTLESKSLISMGCFQNEISLSQASHFKRNVP